MKGCFTAILVLLILAGCSDDGPQPLVGTLERDRIEVAAEIGERLEVLDVEEGDTVVAGTRLARLRTARLDARVEQASAARDAAAARLAEQVRGPRREAITEARAALARTRAVVDRAGRDFARVSALREDGLVTPSELDAARAARDTAAAEREEARARLESLLEGTTVEALEQARAALREAEARLAEVRSERERLDLAAPRDGRVEALPYEPGEYVPEGRPVVVLAAGTPWARVYVPEALRTQIRPGMRAEIRMDGQDRAMPGRVRFIATEAAFTPYFALTERDRGRLVYPAEIVLTDDGPFDLATGVPVQVRFPGLE